MWKCNQQHDVEFRTSFEVKESDALPSSLADNRPGTILVCCRLFRRRQRFAYKPCHLYSTACSAYELRGSTDSSTTAISHPCAVGSIDVLADLGKSILSVGKTTDMSFTAVRSPRTPKNSMSAKSIPSPVFVGNGEIESDTIPFLVAFDEEPLARQVGCPRGEGE